MPEVRMHNTVQIHEADSVLITPVERCKSSNDLGYFYSQTIKVQEEGTLMPTSFQIFFKEAVCKRLENERLADEQKAAQDQANAMEFLERKAKRNQEVI